ncbi:hypothetical protein CL673_06845 [Candidatus Bathyarchaeota archaeon]|jgi:2-dehydropantoate 2-reductase|nr:hypothetical protein [Candidatus Bathyarchaeota archaeon]MDP6049204.1 2-dehydropantoate 2-reductase N-terminal domain-containing protein [Candidatus Bathyarchaeota archaeon]|tara:strand:+ start:461 stop:1438 length:978 start_codon:yes stop_codon:yes gene_type:complete
MRFIIYGAGAVGSIIGGHMYKANNDVLLIANTHHANIINKNGLELNTPDDKYILDIPAYNNISRIKSFKDDDVIFLTMKSQHVLRSLGQLRASAGRDIPVFCFQNGISTEPLAQRVFTNIYGGVISMAGIFLKPGIVYDSVNNGRCFVEVGAYPRGIDCIAKKVAESLKDSGFAGGLNKEVMMTKGAKCLQSLGHALLAITDGKGDQDSFQRSLRYEAKQVWSRVGIKWEDLDLFKYRAGKERGEIIRNKIFLENSTIVSSWQSLVRETGNIEVWQINGDVVDLGKMLNIETPYNEIVCRVAHKMAINGEKPGKYSIQDLLRKIG